jgi:hypothetical protein
MHPHEYKINRKTSPEAVKGMILTVPVADTLDEALTLCQDGDRAVVLAKFNAQNILDTERVGLEVLEGKDALALIAAGDLAGAVALAQAACDAYRAGAKKERVVKVDAAAEAAKAELAVRKERDAKVAAAMAAMDPQKKAKYEKMLAELGLEAK